MANDPVADGSGSSGLESTGSNLIRPKFTHKPARTRGAARGVLPRRRADARGIAPESANPYRDNSRPGSLQPQPPSDERSHTYAAPPHAPERPQRPLARRSLAAFEVIRRLGAGGMAEVFLAKKRGAPRGRTRSSSSSASSRRTARPYASGRCSSRRRRSRRASTTRTSCRSTRFYDLGRRRGEAPRDGVRGGARSRAGSSRARSPRGRRIDPWTAAWIVAEAAKGLHYAHGRKDEGGVPLEIVHRDVSPQNVLLSFEGSVKIADFGIASAEDVRPEAGRHQGQVRLHVPRTGTGRESRSPERPLRARRDSSWEALGRAAAPRHARRGRAPSRSSAPE